MKRILSITLLCALVCTLFTGCQLFCAHEWTSATCTEPRTCIKCKKTEGKALGHQVNEWTVEKTDPVTATETLVKKCLICNKELDTETRNMTALHDEEVFLMTPNEFVSRFSDKLQSLEKSTLIAIPESDNSAFACTVWDVNTSSDVATFLFWGEDEMSKEGNADKTFFNSAMGPLTLSDDNRAAITLIALVLTCDPTLSISEAKDISHEMVNQKSATRNGIDYGFVSSNGGAIVSFVLSNKAS